MLSVLLTASLIFAQQKPKPATDAPLTLKSGAELVQVPVIVRKSGSHVPNLKLEDFKLSQDGRDLKIAAFEEVHSSGETKVKVPAIDGLKQISNYPESGAAKQMTIIAIDIVNTPAMDQAYLREEVIKYLSQASETNEPFALVAITRNGVHVLRDFTTDMASLKATVQKLKGKVSDRQESSAKMMQDMPPCVAIFTESKGCGSQISPAPGNEDAPDHDLQAWAGIQDLADSMAQLQNRGIRIDTLSAIQQLAQALAGFPGRKTLVWASSGFQFAEHMFRLAGGVDRVFKGGPNQDGLDQNVYTWKLLNAANVAVYPIDARGVTNTAFEVMSPVSKNSPLAAEKNSARDNNREIINNFQKIAFNTGGKACFGRTDLHNCMREAAEDSRDYYLLSFYVDKKSTAPGWHKLDVKLDRKANLSFRPGYLYVPDDANASRGVDLQLALTSPLGYTALPFSGNLKQASTGQAKDPAKKLLNFELVLPPSSIALDTDKTNHINLDVIAIVRSKGGQEVAKMAQKIEKDLDSASAETIQRDGINYKNKLELAAGDYGIWFVVRDNISGRTGSIVTRFKVTP
jgi:VWFA-related protein